LNETCIKTSIGPTTEALMKISEWIPSRLGKIEVELRKLYSFGFLHNSVGFLIFGLLESLESVQEYITIDMATLETMEKFCKWNCSKSIRLSAYGVYWSNDTPFDIMMQLLENGWMDSFEAFAPTLNRHLYKNTTHRSRYVLNPNFIFNPKFLNLCQLCIQKNSSAAAKILTETLDFNKLALSQLKLSVPPIISRDCEMTVLYFIKQGAMGLNTELLLGAISNEWYRVCDLPLQANQMRF
jgi:hypothetical protein